MNPQQFLLSLDYELFFGDRVGTVENCLIRPVEAIREVLERYDMKMSLFVDSGFLVMLKKEMLKFPQLREDYQKVEAQLQSLVADGHDVQLHIHPHWEDSAYDGQKWSVDTARYKLHDFGENEIHQIVRKYKKALTDIVGDRVFAFRAGGWCIQPFSAISSALDEEGIWLDSTVFADGISEDSKRWFDFLGAPNKQFWVFDMDPVKENTGGRFVEIPISSFKVSPILFWKMVAIKKLSKGQHVPYGDGTAMTANAKYYWNRLTASSVSVASIDGLKSSLLTRAFKAHKASSNSTIFNVMGHPKSISPYSIKKLDQFLSEQDSLSGITYQDLIALKA